MAHHLQCKVPGEAAWTTIGSSSRPDELARSYLSNMLERYRAMSVLAGDTAFRIISDEQLARWSEAERLATIRIEPSALVDFVVLALLFGAIGLIAGIACGVI